MFSGLASGMTIKFFPLYFARQVWLQPVQTQFIYVALPFFMIVLSKAGQMVAKKVGRVVTSVGMAYIGSLALVSILYYHSNLGLNKPPTLSHLISCCIGVMAGRIHALCLCSVPRIWACSTTPASIGIEHPKPRLCRSSYVHTTTCVRAYTRLVCGMYHHNTSKRGIPFEQQYDSSL